MAFKKKKVLQLQVNIRAANLLKADFPPLGHCLGLGLVRPDTGERYGTWDLPGTSGVEWRSRRPHDMICFAVAAIDGVEVKVPNKPPTAGGKIGYGFAAVEL